MSTPSARVHIQMAKESTCCPLRQTRRNSLPVQACRSAGSAFTASDRGVTGRCGFVAGVKEARSLESSRCGCSGHRKCADVVGLWAIFAKCAPCDHGYISGNRCGRDRRQTLFFGQYAASPPRRPYRAASSAVEGIAVIKTMPAARPPLTRSGQSF